MAETKEVSFDTTILQMGNNTGICVPEQVVKTLEAGKKPPVLVTVNNHTYRNSIAVMGGRFMIAVSAEIRRKAGIQGGDQVRVTLALDSQPRQVEVPSDFQRLLEENAQAKQFFEGLSYSNQQRYVLPIGQAKTAETRQRRMEKAILELSEGKK